MPWGSQHKGASYGTSWKQVQLNLKLVSSPGIIYLDNTMHRQLQQDLVSSVYNRARAAASVNVRRSHLGGCVGTHCAWGKV